MTASAISSTSRSDQGESSAAAATAVVKEETNQSLWSVEIIESFRERQGNGRGMAMVDQKEGVVI